MLCKVVFAVHTPVIVGSPLHLDAVLTAVHPAMHGHAVVSRVSPDADLAAAPLPVDTAKLGGTWVWCASAAEYADTAEFFTDKFSRRRDGIDYTYLRGVQSPSNGLHKDRMDTLYGVSTPWLSFMVSTARPRELERIVKRVHWLGSMRKMGFGQVTGYEIETPGGGWKSCLVRSGWAARNLPSGLVVSERVDFVPVHPPYWHQSSSVPGVLAGTPCSLADGVTLDETRRDR